MTTAAISRVRVSSPDPYQGLKGRAYIEARGLQPKIGRFAQIGILENCPCQTCERERRLPAVQAICAASAKREKQAKRKKRG